MLIDTQTISNLSEPAKMAFALGGAEAYQALLPQKPGNPQARTLLADLTPETVLGKPRRSINDAAAVLSGLWLRHDYLDESHRLSQDINTPSGSYWHAIMHRREGDFWNSKYWLNKCRGHPALGLISRHAADIINAAPASKDLLKLTLGDFDAHGFVDLVEAIHTAPGDSRYPIVVALQQLEWRILFDHCLRSAAG